MSSICALSASLRNASFTATDLRIRLEFGGATELVKIDTADNKTYNITIDDTSVVFTISDAVFGNKKITFETGTDGKTKWIDVVIYQGEIKNFDLANTDKAYMCFALNINASSAQCIAEEKGERLIAKSGNLSIETFLAPTDFNTYINDAKGYESGIEY